MSCTSNPFTVPSQSQLDKKRSEQNYTKGAGLDECVCAVCSTTDLFVVSHTAEAAHAGIPCAANVQCGRGRGGRWGELTPEDPGVKKPMPEEMGQRTWQQHVLPAIGAWPSGATLWLPARLPAPGSLLLQP